MASTPLLAQPAAPERIHATEACSVETRTATPLRMWNGRVAYIEPMAFARGSSASALAGEPMYLWTYPRGERPQPDTTHALIGVLYTVGSVHALPKPPVSGVVTHIRLLAEGNDFDAVFAETRGSGVGARGARLLGYWYARTDGRIWTELQRLPLAAGVDTIDVSEASSLVRAGDRLMLAVPYGPPFQRGVATFTRSAGTWTRDDVFTGGADYIALTAIGDDPLLFLVRPDTTRRPDSNSLFLFRRRSSSWHDARLLLRGGDRPIHRPIVSALGSIHILAWREEDQRTGAFDARAAELRADGTLSAPITIAHQVEGLMPVLGALESLQWVVTTRVPNGPATHGLSEWNAGAPRVRDALADPFTGPALAHAVPGGEVIVGPLVSYAPTDEFLVSGILRFARRCNVAVPR